MSYHQSRSDSPVRVEVVPYGSELYWQTIDIRRDVLRKPLGLDFTAEDLHDDPVNHHFIALIAPQAVGALVVVPEARGWAKIRQVAVLPEFQQKGIGSALMGAAHEYALRAGFNTIHLHARIPAVQFYRRLGYYERGGIFTEIGIPHQDMWIPLKPLEG